MALRDAIADSFPTLRIPLFLRTVLDAEDAEERRSEKGVNLVEPSFVKSVFCDVEADWHIDLCN